MSLAVADITRNGRIAKLELGSSKLEEVAELLEVTQAVMQQQTTGLSSLQRGEMMKS